MTRDNLQAEIHQHMENDGDTERTSQKICVLNAICTLERAVNGIIQEDMQ